MSLTGGEELQKSFKAARLQSKATERNLVLQLIFNLETGQKLHFRGRKYKSVKVKAPHQYLSMRGCLQSRRGA